MDTPCCSCKLTRQRDGQELTDKELDTAMRQARPPGLKEMTTPVSTQPAWHLFCRAVSSVAAETTRVERALSTAARWATVSTLFLKPLFKMRGGKVD